MNVQRTLFRTVLEIKYQTINNFKKFHVFPLLNRQLPSNYGKKVDSSLFLTTLPKSKRQKKPKCKVKMVQTGSLLISCKNEKLNHYQNTTYGKFDEIPLVSKGWHHRKSKGDYFTILPVYEHPAFTTSRAADLPKTFQELNISDRTIEELQKMGVYNPTVIQAKAITKLQSGSNVLITAETGCGKTLAYVIPMMENILKLKKIQPTEINAPLGIILLPTKELAYQVGKVVTTLGEGLGLHCVTLISGDFENIVKDPNIEVTDVIVSTLGILMRYMNEKIYTTTKCKHLILDEADMFFEHEFIPDLKKFTNMAKLNFIGLGRSVLWTNTAQLCLTSATSIRTKSEDFQSVIPMTELEIVSTGYLHKVLFHIKQHFMRIKKLEKPETLLKIIKSNVKKEISTIVFSNHTDTCNFIQYFLTEQGINSVKVNARMFSDERLKSFFEFKEKKVFVLTTTDCMARGLDMPWVKQIINYEFPNNISSYIHRCGRTGRLGYDKNCLVTNFVSGKNEIRFVNEIEMAARAGRELSLKLKTNVRDKRKLRKHRGGRRRRRRRIR